MAGCWPPDRKRLRPRTSSSTSSGMFGRCSWRSARGVMARGSSLRAYGSTPARGSSLAVTPARLSCPAVPTSRSFSSVSAMPMKKCGCRRRSRGLGSPQNRSGRSRPGSWPGPPGPRRRRLGRRWSKSRKTTGHFSLSRKRRQARSSRRSSIGSSTRPSPGRGSHPPRQLRPHRPAAGAGGGGGLRRRSRPRRL